jgi:hypothetical protein
MKYIKQKILLFVLLLAMAMPVSVYAAGEGNIDNGGGWEQERELIFGAATMRGCV